MAEATVTVKVSTTEFGIIAAALIEKRDNDLMIVGDREAPASVRAAARTSAAQVDELISRLK
jgi:hypothetical protein